MKDEPKNISERIKEALAEALGLETEDINEEDGLSTDLHMRPSDLADFTEKLNSMGIETAKLDLSEIETVKELIESLTDDIYLE